jgi:hypothetical protein
MSLPLKGFQRVICWSPFYRLDAGWMKLVNLDQETPLFLAGLIYPKCHLDILRINKTLD